MERQLTCICCPVGCQLTVSWEEGKEPVVTGNRCPNGDSYGKKEVTNPTRIVTSLVRVKGIEDAVISVKTDRDIPKGKIEEVLAQVAKAEATGKEKIGDIIIPNVAGCEANIIVTRELE